MSMLAGLALTPRLARERNSNNVSNNSNSNSTDVEMQQQTTTTQRHERETSGRSILSNIGSTLSNLRERERDQDLRTAVRRAGNVSYDERGDVRERDIRGFSSTAAGFNPNQLNNRNPNTNGNNNDLDLEAQVINPPNGNLSINPLTTNSNTPAIIKVSNKVRKEREEQSTLFGPNLANYFSSGASTTGPINSTNPNNINPIPTSTTSINNLNHPSSLTDLNNGIPETPAAIPETPGVGEAGFSFAGYNSTLTNQAIQQKKLRLGSRGRARGASLSGLSQSLENSESILNLNKAYNRGENGTGEESLGSESITMAEGIEIETLKKWIEKSSGCGPLTLNSENGNSNVGGASGLEIGNAVCSTLQAFVNLKRNTIRLTTTAPSNSDSNNQTSLPVETTVDVTPSPNLSSPPTSPLVGQESKVGGGAVAIDHPLSSTTENPTSSSLSNPTHLLHFEYDCASPSASIQIFVRASRKHGSWSTWQAKQHLLEPQQQASTSKQDQEDGLPKGPPPHVLGWPVYFNKLKKGFGKPNKAELNLRLNLYAPPSTNNNTSDVPVVSNDGMVEKEKFTGGMGLEEIMTTDQFVEPNSTQPIQETNSNQNLNLSPNANENLENKVKDLKEKEKGNENKDNNNTRETLKIALVVEALDEDFKPLKEPNLQTTYLRMSSNSFNEVGNRIWSVQVEGQEAEIGVHRFQLQELYGLSTRPPPVRTIEASESVPLEEGEDPTTIATQATTTLPPVAADFEGSNGSECLICLSSPPTTLLLPCTHGLCLECAVQLRDSTKATRESERRRGRAPRRKYACPVCRRGYVSMLHLSPANEKESAQNRA